MGPLRVGSVRIVTARRAGVRRRRGSDGLRIASWSCALAAASSVASCGPEVTARHQTYAAIVAQEDARGTRGLETIQEALADPDPWIRAVAVRSLGRLEDPERVPRIAEVLADPDPEVRAAAAVALGQSVFGQAASPGIPHLESLAETEADAAVLGALATTAGRVSPAGAAERMALAAVLSRTAESLGTGEGDPDLAGRLGLARGLEAFARQNRLDPETADRVARLAETLTTTDGRDGWDPRAARIRALATATLDQVGHLDGEALTGAASDPDASVRRVALVAVGRSGNLFQGLVPSALEDSDARVRIAALAAYDRWLRPSRGCGPILARLHDADSRVATVAADHLASPCPDAAGQRAALDSLVAVGLDASTGAGESEGAPPEEVIRAAEQDWHRSAHALVALAAVAPEVARTRLDEYRDHPSPFARAWAARAAARAADVETLDSLARDPDSNVRTAVLAGLGPLGRAGDQPLFREQLDANDPQLVMTAAGLLDGGDTANVQRAAQALARFTELRRETARDVRMALVDFLGSARAADPGALDPYLSDFDPVVAEAAGAHIARATGAAPEATPEPLPPLPVPDAERLAHLERSDVVLTMARGGTIVIRLRPDLAATNAHRFARLAEEGHFDGLTFHRVVPNFVIQGGSPGANEYAGDGPYTRDEVGSHGHWRGTVGLSTRGRDTGDGQIFVNLVDNPRLDFNYTIFGEVVEGMDVVDRVMEGDVILEARLVRAGRR